MARRADVAQRRREGPLTALRHRVGLLEREVPRLELEVATLERRAARIGHRAPSAQLFVGAVLRGGGLALAALAWTVGLATLTPGARPDDPLRLAAMGVVVALVALTRR
ncbi:MAG: hypothetical protein ACOZQL_24500 [Myxococcota bacterium]